MMVPVPVPVLVLALVQEWKQTLPLVQYGVVSEILLRMLLEMTLLALEEYVFGAVFLRCQQSDQSMLVM
jgi:hypothetical protein